MPDGQTQQNANADKASALAAIRGGSQQTPQAPQMPAPMPFPVTVDPSSIGNLLNTNPVMPTLGAQIDPSQISAEQIARTRALSGQVSDLMAQQKAMGQPKSPTNPQGYPTPGWTPDFGSSGTLGKIGKGILYGLSLTAPGRSVESAMYERKLRPYELERANVADSLRQIGFSPAQSA